MVVMIMRVFGCHQTAHASAERVTMRAISHVRAGRIGALAFHMVVMAFLNCADFAFEPKHLHTVLAQHAGRRRHRTKGRMCAIFDRDLTAFAILQGQHLAAIPAQSAIGRRRCRVLL